LLVGLSSDCATAKAKAKAKLISDFCDEEILSYSSNAALTRREWKERATVQHLHLRDEVGVPMRSEHQQLQA